MADEHKAEGDLPRPGAAARTAARAAKLADKAERMAAREKVAARFVERVAHVGSAVARELALSSIVDVVLDETIQTLGASFAFVYLADDDRRILKLVGERSLPDDLKEKLSLVSFDAPLLTARAATARQIQLVNAIDQLDPVLDITHELLWRTKCGSIVAMPLAARGRLVGVLTFAMKLPHDFTLEERAALENCGEIFAFGIANASAYEEERRLRSLFEAVGIASTHVADQLGLQPALQSTVDEARSIVDAQYAALGIVVSDDQPFSPWVFSGMTAEQAAAIAADPRPVGTLGIIAPQDKTVRTPDVRQHPAFRGLPEHHPTLISFLSVPIRHQQFTVGNLYVANRHGAAEFTREDQQALELLASHASATIHQSQLHDQLEFERARFSTIVESAPHGVHFVEAGTETIIANRRAHEIVGQADVHTLDDYQGQVCLADGAALPRDAWPARRVLRGETFGTQEMIIRTPDGREVPVLLSAAPVRRNGHLDGVVVVYEDISILKELQRLREEWAAIITHDLRQPLTLITTHISLLQAMAESADPKRLLMGLGKAQKAVIMLARMINDLTDVSNIEAKRLQLRCEVIELDALVREVVERQQVTAPDRVINLEVSGPILKIMADPLRVAQVLGNLLENAVKYAEPGTSIEIQVRRVDDEARVSVANQGPGISPEDLPKIFDRYYRTAHAHASAARGLGLGLHITKGLVEAHGGRIWAESRPDETTRFHFALPVVQEVLL